MQDLNHALYIHVPYCHQFCTFCKYKHQITNDQTAQYHRHIIDVITTNRDKLIEFDEIYFGGGTPTTLSAQQFSEIIEALWFVKINKWCCEGSPSTITIDHLNMWIKHKFDYISMGVQTFNTRILNKINRKETPVNWIAVIVDILQAAGIIVNIDLICGLEHGNEKDIHSLIEDMDLVTKFIGAHSVTVHVNYDKNNLKMREVLLKKLTQEYNGYTCVNHDMSTKYMNIKTDADYKAEYKFMDKYHNFYHRQTGALPYTPEYKWKTQSIYPDSMDLYERSLDNQPKYARYKARTAYEITKLHRDARGLLYY